MNKKGFTLAELLGVIVIIGVLAIISVSVIDKNIKEGKVQTCKTQETNIIEGAKAWAIDNTSSLPTSVTISTLESGSYIEKDLKSPITGNKYSSSTKVNITSSGNGYNFTITYGDAKENCSNEEIG